MLGGVVQAIFDGRAGRGANHASAVRIPGRQRPFPVAGGGLLFFVVTFGFDLQFAGK